MKKMKYVAPSMTVMVVELEKGFMSASVVDKETMEVTASDQGYEEIDATSTFGTDGKQTGGSTITWE